MKFFNSLVLIPCLIILLNCSGDNAGRIGQTEEPERTPKNGEITLMSFNVYNLFDTTHDEG